MYECSHCSQNVVCYSGFVAQTFLFVKAIQMDNLHLFCNSTLTRITSTEQQQLYSPSNIFPSCEKIFLYAFALFIILGLIAAT